MLQKDPTLVAATVYKSVVSSNMTIKETDFLYKIHYALLNEPKQNCKNTTGNQNMLTIYAHSSIKFNETVGLGIINQICIQLHNMSDNFPKYNSVDISTSL